MFRNIAILFCLFCLSFTKTFCTLDLVTQIIQAEDTNITRVRTLDEQRASPDKYAVLDFIGIVEQYDGYTAEEHTVQTEDGYILTLHRITGSPQSPKSLGKPVILYIHGLLGSSDCLVVLGPDKALPYQLADAGYDVWFGNVRGNTYSKQHVKYSSKGNNKKFWDFSMDEMGLIDLPKFIDAILEKTKQKKLTYIGYSMGTTLSFILLSEKPEYNEKMNLVVNIAPVAFFSRPLNALQTTLIVSAPPAKSLALASKVYQILPQSKLIQIVGEDVCSNELGKVFCGTFLSAVVNYKTLNFTSLPTLITYIPAGTSLNTVDHYYQMISKGKFRKYDFGFLRNIMKYRSAIPPEYDLSKINSPQVIFYSEDDVFVSVKDATKVKDTLKNVVAFEKVPAKGFNHVDYVFAVNAKTVVYNRLVQVIEKYA